MIDPHIELTDSHHTTLAKLAPFPLSCLYGFAVLSFLASPRKK